MVYKGTDPKSMVNILWNGETDYEAEEDFTISITDRESNNPLNPIWSETYSLDENKTYVLVASGVISTQSYSPAEPFNIFVYDMGQEMSMQNGFTDLMVFHGATDAPTVDIIEQGNESVLTIDDLSYGDFVQERDYPKTQLGFYSNILRGVPYSQTTVDSTPAPSFLSQAIGAGVQGLGIAANLGWSPFS